MTILGHGYVMENEGHKDATKECECRDCEYFEHNYCECYDSDHFAHMLLPMHPACRCYAEEE